MADVLARIVARKRKEAAERLHGKVIPAEPTGRSLVNALRRPGARFIMEIKPKSPSGHVARHDPETALRAYRPVADAISVLTDEEDFGGSLELLASIRKDYGGPILAKDFIVDARQVREARSHGADAVLCMLSVLDDASAKAVLDEAASLNMDVLVEVHDETELERAIALNAGLIGINNRDLKSLTTDLAVTERLAAKVPDHVTLISESGISGRADVMRLGPKVDGFLVGSHLMAAEDISLSARELVHGPVKICGLTNVEDVAMAARFGASHAGLIMVPDTPRALSVAEARTLAMTAADLGMKTIGVFRDAPVEKVANAARTLRLSGVQLHGKEDAQEIKMLRSILQHGQEIWAARQVQDDAPSEARDGADRALFDSGRGGTGRPFDWSLIKDDAALPNAFLAGGISGDNGRSALAVGAYGIDVGSGVEAKPGRKDQDKMAALFAALRAPARGEDL